MSVDKGHNAGRRSANRMRHTFIGPYRRRRPLLGGILVVFGIPVLAAGAVLGWTYGEDMVLDGLPWFAMLVAGVVAATLGFVLIFTGERRRPSLREGYAEPDRASRRGLLFGALGAPLVGFGLSGIAGARLTAAGLGGADSRPLAWTIFIAGLIGVFAGAAMLVRQPELRPPDLRRSGDGRFGRRAQPRHSVPSRPSGRNSGVVLAGLGLLSLGVLSRIGPAAMPGLLAAGFVCAFVAGLLIAIWPRDPLPAEGTCEARQSVRIGGSIMAIGTALMPVVSMAALSSSADPDTRWSMAIVFLIFGTALASAGGWALKDRKVALRVDESGLFWRKIGTVPWMDVVRARIQVGRRVCRAVVTIREPDGVPLTLTIDLMGLDLQPAELAAALQKWGVPSE